MGGSNGGSGKNVFESFDVDDFSEVIEELVLALKNIPENIKDIIEGGEDNISRDVVKSGLEEIKQTKEELNKAEEIMTKLKLVQTMEDPANSEKGDQEDLIMSILHDDTQVLKFLDAFDECPEKLSKSIFYRLILNNNEKIKDKAFNLLIKWIGNYEVEVVTLRSITEEIKNMDNKYICRYLEVLQYHKDHIIEEKIYSFLTQINNKYLNNDDFSKVEMGSVILSLIEKNLEILSYRIAVLALSIFDFSDEESDKIIELVRTKEGKNSMSEDNTHKEIFEDMVN